MKTLEKLKHNGIHLNQDEINKICIKYKISELSVFGSSLRDDFDANSDLDILISFQDIWQNDPFDILYIADEFKQFVKREVDIVCSDCVKNPIRRKNILSSREIIYGNK